MLQQLYMPCGHDHGAAYTMNADDWVLELAKLLAAETRRVWRKKGVPDTINKELTTAYAEIIMQAVDMGYGEFDYNTPDGVFYEELRRNVYQFSAAKNYTQLVQLSKALIGDDLKLRSFSQFKQAAFEINNEHVSSWLQAEYDTAVGSAQMARRWREIEATKDSLPLLEFDAVLDDGTTALCRGLDKVVKPVNDPFWNLYYPPNHFRCRSDVRQLSTGKVTPDYEINHPEKMPEMFKTNMAKTGAVFPPNHPYFIGAPQSVMNEAAKLMQRNG